MQTKWWTAWLLEAVTDIWQAMQEVRCSEPQEQVQEQVN